MSLSTESGRDYYLAHPPRQPKKDTGGYVASKGLLVPHRFKDLAGAISSGNPFIIRSEHPQDYVGASGLGYSLFVKPEDCAGDKIAYRPVTAENWKRFLQTKDYRSIEGLPHRLAVNAADRPQTETEAGLTHLSSINVDDYCRYLGIDPTQFLSQQSYSYWEGLGGFNRAVIADNVVPDKYFVFTQLFRPDAGVMWLEADGYQIIEGRKVIDERVYRLPSEITTDCGSLIDFYESVRNLSRFSPNHCPMVEAQTYEGKHYFLQYLRVYDFSPATFSLERGKTEDEFEAVFVRGATPPEGLYLTLNVRGKPSALEPAEEAGYEETYNPAFVEALAPKLKLQLLGIGEHHNLLAASGHLQRSALFKPKISAVLDYDSIDALVGITYDPNQPVLKYRIHIISDGRKAYIRKA